MQAHGPQKRASGDPYFSHPLEVAGILTDLKLDTPTIATALLHDTVEDTAATIADIENEFRRRDRGPGRRRHQALAARALLRAHQAGREFPQVDARDVERHPRASGQARRPPAQHADAVLHQERRHAAPHRPGDDRDLRAARRPHRHAEHARGARRPRLRRARPAGARVHRQAAGAARRPVLAAHRAHRRRDQAQARRGRHRSLDPGPRQAALLDLAQAQGQEDQFRAALRRVRFSRRRRLGGGLLPRARRPASHLAHGARALQGLHLAAQVERLSLDPHHGDGAREPARRGADPHPGDARRRRARRRRPLALSRAGRRKRSARGQGL